jgi:hypothetical protein
MELLSHDARPVPRCIRAPPCSVSGLLPRPAARERPGAPTRRRVLTGLRMLHAPRPSSLISPRIIIAPAGVSNQAVTVLTR